MILLAHQAMPIVFYAAPSFASPIVNAGEGTDKLSFICIGRRIRHIYAVGLLEMTARVYCLYPTVCFNCSWKLRCVAHLPRIVFASKSVSVVVRYSYGTSEVCIEPEIVLVFLIRSCSEHLHSLGARFAATCNEIGIVRNFANCNFLSSFRHRNRIAVDF